jgi:anthranilate/para-aminobenzoate synthase component I
MLRSAPTSSQWSQRSIIASPRAVLRIDETSWSWQGHPPCELDHIDRGEIDDPMAVLQHAIAATPPFKSGFWIGYFSYELGRIIEPKAAAAAAHSLHSPSAVDDRQWPLIQLAWCPDALVFENQTKQWLVVGDGSSLIESLRAGESAVNAPPRFGELRSSLTKGQYCDAAQYIIDLIAAGDIFQANLTQRLSCDFSGSSRMLAMDALRRSEAWYGAYLEFPLSRESERARTICSMSPELFLSFDASTRGVITRPIKGTRPLSTSREELARSEKDIAELNMIIDLMRNDLGRVCEFGSVRVPRPRTIESHAGVHHGVGEVVGVLRANCKIADLLRATFPAGSVTGAPKIRAMQIIDEVEPVRRGPYCGAIGVIDAKGNACFNVAIRTMCLTGNRAADEFDIYTDAVLDYGAGGAIVADPDPAAEYRESLDKTAVLRDVVERFPRDCSRRDSAAPQAAGVSIDD